MTVCVSYILILPFIPAPLLLLYFFTFFPTFYMSFIHFCHCHSIVYPSCSSSSSSRQSARYLFYFVFVFHKPPRYVIHVIPFSSVELSAFQSLSCCFVSSFSYFYYCYYYYCCLLLVSFVALLQQQLSAFDAIDFLSCNMKKFHISSYKRMKLAVAVYFFKQLRLAYRRVRSELLF